MWRTVVRDERAATDHGWSVGRYLVRVMLTLVGVAVLLFGSFIDWLQGVTGDRLSMEVFYRTGIVTTGQLWRSAAVIVLATALVGLVGLATTRGGLTRLGGALAIAAFALVAIQAARAGDFSTRIDAGPWLLLAGGIVLVMAGLPSTRPGRVRERNVLTTSPVAEEAHEHAAGGGPAA